MSLYTLKKKRLVSIETRMAVPAIIETAFLSRRANVKLLLARIKNCPKNPGTDSDSLQTSTHIHTCKHPLQMNQEGHVEARQP